MRKQYHFRPSLRGFIAWDVDRLIALSVDLPRFQIDPATLPELDSTFWFQDDSTSPTCRAVLEHMRLVEAVTFDHPIILAADGGVMDGMHRVLKALLVGRVAIDAVQFERTPDPDFIDVHPDELPY